MARPRIALYTTGGTIASIPAAGTAGATPRLGADELVAAVPQLAGVAGLDAATFRQVPSPELTVADLVELRARAASDVEAGAAGVVITQGTDTLQESAYVLDALWDRDAPLVLTGAMRTPDQAGADGPANLLAAVRVAASPSARGLGCVAVMNAEIHAARFVRKTDTSSPAAFRSALCGPVGRVTEGRVGVFVRPPRRRPLRVPDDAPQTPVALVRAALGDDGRLVDGIAALGYRGLVVEATGGGHLPASWVPRLEALAATMPVVLASRTGGGELLRSTYGFPGSETDLLGRGLIPAGVLDGLTARLELTLLLMTGAGPDAAARAFEELGYTLGGGR